MSVNQISAWRTHIEAAAAVSSSVAEIEIKPSTVDMLAHHPIGHMLNRLGVPTQFGGNPAEGLLWRTVLYETLAAIDPAYVAGAPGPGMAGFVVANLGDKAQKSHFFSKFNGSVAWSFFALTERQAGSDTGGISMRAERLGNGTWRLNGEKYLISHGRRAEIGVVFARSAAGPLGIDVFVIEPQNTDGITARKLETVGLRGLNLSHLDFDDVIVDDTAHLGRHLKPTARASGSASATFDALRPCVAAIALGIARGALDKADAAGLVAVGSRTPDRLALQSLLNRILALCAAGDRGERRSRDAGLTKACASALSELVIARLIEDCPPGAAAAHPWLAKAFRDVRAIEYTEGVSTLHRQNAATLFAEARHAATY